MAQRVIWAALPLSLVLCTAAGAAQGPLASQDSGSAQPTLPKSIPGITIPDAGGQASSASKPKHKGARHSPQYDKHHHQFVRARDVAPVDRPALANVLLLERLPHPPQPPHVTVPVPAYPLENFVTYFTAPPPPVVCRPTRYDRYKPNLDLVDEQPVLCTADNP